MQHIFISYSRIDSDFVELIESDLVESGHDIWRDIQDIRCGEQWSDSIEDGIREAYVFLVILSPHALASEWVNREIQLGLQHQDKIPIIPVMLEPVELPIDLQRWQMIDFTDVTKLQGPAQIEAYRQAIRRLLRDLEQVRPVLRYLRELKDPSEDTRENAARMLGDVGDSRAAKPLIEALSDPDEDVQFEATRALGKLKSKSAYKHLVRLLSQDDPDICAAAADALGRLGLPQSIGALLEMLEHPDRFVRECGARSLGRLQQAGAVEPLIRVMRNDSISDVREAAIEALQKIGGPLADRAIAREKAMREL